MRFRRVVIRCLGLLLCAILFGPFLLIALFAHVDPPITPLMVLRWQQSGYAGAPPLPDWRRLEEISPHLPRAVIAGEDNYFCIHGGFDIEASLTQVELWLDGKRPRGASTITMQMAKNLFLWPDRSTARKLIEAWLTPQIEFLWSKQRTLEVYLNVIEFGPGIYGAEAAARHHFAVPAVALDANQAALLAAVLPNPHQRSASRPSTFVRDHARTIGRRVGTLGPLLDCTVR